MLKTSLAIALTMASLSATAAFIAPIKESETVTKLCRFGMQEDCEQATSVVENEAFKLDSSHFLQLSTKYDNPNGDKAWIGAMVFAEEGDNKVKLTYVNTVGGMVGKGAEMMQYNQATTTMNLQDVALISGHAIRYLGNSSFVVATPQLINQEIKSGGFVLDGK